MFSKKSEDIVLETQKTQKIGKKFVMVCSAAIRHDDKVFFKSVDKIADFAAGDFAGSPGFLLGIGDKVPGTRYVIKELRKSETEKLTVEAVIGR